MSKCRVLLINPPQAFFPGSLEPSSGVPIGIMYIAAVLDKAGWDVQILDAFISDFSPRKEGKIVQIGMSWDRITHEIEQRKPDIVGITNPFTTQIDNAIKVAQIVNEVDPSILTVVGGPHVSAQPTQFLEQVGDVDIVVMGEGENTMLDIVEHYAQGKGVSKVEGIAYKKDGRVVLNPRRAYITDLDELPFPAYHLVNMEKYLRPPKRIRYRSFKSSLKREIPMVTSRGCPFNCVFCSVHLHMGRKWRAHSPEYVIAHIEHVVSKYDVEHVHFEDDNLTLDIERFNEILEGVIAKGIKFSWSTPNGIRAEGLDMGLLKKMKQTNCTGLTIGIESGDQHILDKVINKHLRLEDVIEMARMCKQVGLKLAGFYVIGFPGEKKEDMERTVEFALKLRKEYGVEMNLFRATPLPETRLYQICKSKGYLTRELTPSALSQATLTYGEGLIETEDFTTQEVEEIAARAIATHGRLSLLEHIRHPVSTAKLLVTYPRESIRFIRNLAGL